MREIVGLTQRMLLITSTTSWRYRDLEDLHDTAQLVVKLSAKILAERAQLKFERF